LGGNGTRSKQLKKRTEVPEGILVLVIRSVLIPTAKEKKNNRKGVKRNGNGCEGGRTGFLRKKPLRSAIPVKSTEDRGAWI